MHTYSINMYIVYNFHIICRGRSVGALCSMQYKDPKHVTKIPTKWVQDEKHNPGLKSDRPLVKIIKRQKSKALNPKIWKNFDNIAL